RCTCSTVHAMVALLPLPVMPRRVWNRSPRSTPVASASMAPGWSPAGAKSETTLNGGTVRIVPGGCVIYPGDRNGRDGRDGRGGRGGGPPRWAGPVASFYCASGSVCPCVCYGVTPVDVKTSFFDKPLMAPLAISSYVSPEVRAGM